MKRTNISSGAKWEDIVGYSRAVKIGNRVEVCGTAAPVVDGEVVGKNDMYEQSRQCLLIIEKALKEAGAELSDVVRTRMYVTDISKWEGAGKAHSEFFGSVKPATTLVEISKLIHPDMWVEIEASAIVAE